MMSYKLTVAVSNPYATYQERDKATRDAVKEFGTRLESPSLTASVPLDATLMPLDATEFQCDTCGTY